MDVGLPRDLSAFFSLTLSLSLSCARADGGGGHVEAKLERGAKVLVEQTAAEFFEGRVLSVEGSALKVQGLLLGDVRSVARADVQPLGGGVVNPTSGFGICRVATQAWAGCRVLAADAARLSVELADGTKRELAAQDVLSASELSRLNISQRFQRQASERGFVEEARRQSPRVPASYRVAAQANLLARAQDGYYAVKVRELVEAGAYVTWPDGRPPSRVDAADLAPLPPYHLELRPGEFVLLTPLAPTEAWPVGRIEQAYEGRVTGRRADGEPFDAPTRAVVPLGP